MAVLRLLPVTGRLRAAATCTYWRHAASHPDVWRDLHLSLSDERDSLAQLHLVRCYGRYLLRLELAVAQDDQAARKTACEILGLLCDEKVGSCLRELRVSFTGDNPFFYSGLEFVDALKLLLTHQRYLKVFHVGDLPVCLDGELVRILAAGAGQLEKVHLMNEQLVVKVEPEAVQELVRKNPHLRELSLMHASFDEDVLFEFIASGRKPLEKLTLWVIQCFIVNNNWSVLL